MLYATLTLCPGRIVCNVQCRVIGRQSSFIVHEACVFNFAFSCGCSLLDS